MHTRRRRPLDLDQLHALIQVADTGSVLGSARQLGLTRSSLRRRLAALEAQVGTALLQRDGKGTQLTAAGRLLVEEGRVLVRAAFELKDRARQVSAAPIGELRVIEPVGLPAAARAQALLSTRAAFGELRLRVIQVSDPLAHVDEPFDLMIHAGPPPQRAGWFSRVLLRLPLRVQASAAYLEEFGVPETLEDVHGHRVLGRACGGGAAVCWPLLDGGEWAVEPWIETHDYALLRHIAAAGGGLLLGPTLGFEQGAPGLATVLDDVVGGEEELRITSRLSERADARTSAVIGRMLDALAALGLD